jgi:hypothetical protein
MVLGWSEGGGLFRATTPAGLEEAYYEIGEGNPRYAIEQTNINSTSNSLLLTIGPGDFLVHHAIALGLHTTTLILVKGICGIRLLAGTLQT